MWRVAAAALALLSSAACSGSGEGCRTSQDCVDQKLQSAVCANGKCVVACEQDLDCRDRPQDDNGKICQSQICVPGCLSADEGHLTCESGESCVAGRCAISFQSFEQTAAQQAGDPVSLASLGFAQIPSFDGQARLENRSVGIAHRGKPGCNQQFNDLLKCGGVAGDGVYFLELQRQKVTSTREFDTSCGSCRCCLECRDPVQREGGATSCLGVVLPRVDSCTATPPPECNAICSECASCPIRTGSFGERLNDCEKVSAGRACQLCLDYATCPRCPSCGAGKACVAGVCEQCPPLQAACRACRDAVTEQDPNLRQQAEQLCTTQGRNGCYTVPLNAPRAELTDDEQAVESPEISLAGLTGDLVLELFYVPFNIQRCYFRELQDKDPTTFPQEAQEVALQFCAGSCDRSASWKDAKLVDGSPGTQRTPTCRSEMTNPATDPLRSRIPREAELGNGLRYAEQASLDWRIGLLQAVIPAEMRTPNFRYRFVPRLTDDAIIGIDRVVIRRAR